jgi:hypothetical protein
MDTRERIRGRYALSAVVVLTATTDCGNSLRELLQPPSAMTVVSGADRHDTPIRQAGGLQISRRGETGPSERPGAMGVPTARGTPSGPGRGTTPCPGPDPLSLARQRIIAPAEKRGK